MRRIRAEFYREARAFNVRLLMEKAQPNGWALNLRNNPCVFCAFQRRADTQACPAKDDSQYRRCQSCGLCRQAVALIGNHIFKVSTCSPTAGTAEVQKRVLGHEEQYVCVLLSADLQAEVGFGG